MRLITDEQRKRRSPFKESSISDALKSPYYLEALDKIAKRLDRDELFARRWDAASLHEQDCYIVHLASLLYECTDET